MKDKINLNIDLSKDFKLIQLNEIPEIDFSTDSIIRDGCEEIIDNFESLNDSAIACVIFSLDNKIVKPLVLYNLFYSLEIFLKLYLVKNTNIEMNSIFKMGHNIFELINVAQKNKKMINFDKLKYLLKRFENKNGDKLNLEKYYNFKYNCEKENNNLIFTKDISDKELLLIKEVINWIKKNM